MMINVDYFGIPLLVSGNYIPKQKGKTNGAPEDCYEEEDAYIENMKVSYEGQDLTHSITADALLVIRELACTEVEEILNL